jgi:CBS domain-containing protein
MAREQSSRDLMVIILEDEDRLQALLEGLYDAGVPGVTVIDSVGGHRTHSWLEDIGLGGIANLLQSRNYAQKALLSVMEHDIVDGAIAAAEQAVGGFGRPQSGILFTIPVGYTVGMYKRKKPQPESEPFVSERAVRIRDMPVKQAADLINSDVVTIPSNASVFEAVSAMQKNPATHVAAVVSREEHLLGLVTLRSLADHVFFGIMPELFFSEVFDQARAEEFGRMSSVRSVSDCMMPAVAVHASDSVREAFRIMHENQLSGLPIIDDENHVVGCLNLLELLSLVIKEGGEAYE